MIPKGPQIRKYYFPDIFNSPDVVRILVALKPESFHCTIKIKTVFSFPL